MRPATILAWVFLGGLLLPGCPGMSDRSNSTREPRTLFKKTELEAKIAELQANNEILSAHIKELVAREQALAKELRRVQFISKQQAQQIDALADAPLHRDMYKARAEKLQAEVDQLKLQIAELTRLIEQLRNSAELAGGNEAE